MILISVKSDIVEDKRQFKSEKEALTFLKRIKSLHDYHRLKTAGKKPKRIRGKGSKFINEKRMADWKLILSTSHPLRIEIINTEHNQLSLTLKSNG